MNQFNTISPQLALQNINIAEAEKKSFTIGSLHTMSVISTVFSSTLTITMDAIDALVREEIEREKNTENMEETSNVNLLPTLLNGFKKIQTVIPAL